MKIKIELAKIVFLAFCWLTIQCCCLADDAGVGAKAEQKEGLKMEHSDSYWKNKLSPDVYQVTRCSGTEPPFTGKYWNCHEDGTYTCSNCGAILFTSKDKFDSGTGWPSFSKAKPNSVEVREDLSGGMRREEIICKRCGAHLGHVFPDGPAPTGERFCVNSASLNFQSAKPTNK